MATMEDFEVETSLVFTKRLKLRIMNGQLTTGDMRVFESEEPYALIIFIETEQHEELRTDILKEDLAREMRAWLEGKYIRHPAALAPARVDEAIMKFIKFAKTPRQEDLIMWILSRCEVYPRSASQSETELVFGGKSLEESDERLLELKHSIENPLTKTASIAAARSLQDDSHYLTHTENANTSKLKTHALSQSVNMTKGETLKQRMNFKHGDELGMFAMSQQLLGTSATLSKLKTKSRTIKGRTDAKVALPTKNFTSDHWRLCSEIEHARKEIEQKLDIRRRMMEVAKTRQVQTSEKFHKIKDTLKEQQGGNRFISDATEELLTLKKIEQDIEDDILRQRNRVQRGAQQVFWTIAPAGFANRRGHSVRGPSLGPGPLPPKATGSLKNPKIETATLKYYWDSAGRRHKHTHSLDGNTTGSLVTQAMDAIRRAAANITAFKLDLKSVFEQFDTSGDGFLSMMEMASAFLAMGVKLDVSTMNAIYKHFDPDGSGSVHYGEFVWAFFNRRGLVRQWKRATTHLTSNQIKSIFHTADKNGNGTLSFKEFKKVLSTLKMDIPDANIQILIDRFDVDGDGEIDLTEFFSFIESEQKNFADNTTATSESAAVSGQSKALLLPAPRTTAASHHPRGGSGGRSERPKSAPVHRPRGRDNHNVTAPYRLQAAHPHHSQSHYEEEAEHEVEEEDKEQLDDLDYTRVKHGQTIATRSQEPLPSSSQPHAQVTAGEEVDVMWMSRMLQAQAEIEGRLGNRYYRNNNQHSDSIQLK